MSLVQGLQKAFEYLEKTHALLYEADNIGLWSKSDDCSDNRNKRRLLREADWESSAAVRAAAAAREGHPFASLAELEGALRALVTSLEPLPDFVTDTMDKNPDLDYRVGVAMSEIERLSARTKQILATLPPA